MDMYITRHYQSMAEKVWNFKTRSSDVFVVTYPKCGTTLTHELTWQIANGVQVDSELSKEPIFKRAPWIEFSCIGNPTGLNPDQIENPTSIKNMDLFVDSVDYTNKFKSPRIIKTHLPMSMLPSDMLDNAKAIYVAR